MADNPIREHFRAQIGKDVANTPQGFSEWLQPKMIEVLEDSITIEVKVRPEMCNPVGTLHGGIHSAILDEVIGMTVAAMGNETHFVSLNMTTDYLRAARAGELIRATSQIVKKGRTAIHLIGQITNAEGKELSRATQNMVTTGAPMRI
ncbi:MAG: hotdog fold thioesterase [Flavobacteriales bacterium]|nr:hotdog fold thioesterase [Flavobacteriales bacterium]